VSGIVGEGCGELLGKFSWKLSGSMVRRMERMDCRGEWTARECGRLDGANGLWGGNGCGARNGMGVWMRRLWGREGGVGHVSGEKHRGGGYGRDCRMRGRDCGDG
jgi:hypothetical protein